MIDVAAVVIEYCTLFKGTVHRKITKYIFFLLFVVRFIKVVSFGDVGRRDFCLLSNIMGLNGALNVKSVLFV